MAKCLTCDRDLRKDGIKNTTGQCRQCHIEEWLEDLEERVSKLEKQRD